MIIDTLAIRDFIKDMSLDNAIDTEIEDTILNKLKDDEEYLYKCDLNTIIKLQNAVNRHELHKKQMKEQARKELIKAQKVQYIGMDIGQVRIITASNYEMDNYIVLKEKNITAAIKKYNKTLDHLMKTKNHKGKDTLLKSFKQNIKNMVQDDLLFKIEHQYQEPTIFVIGKNHLIQDKYQPQYILTECIFEILKEVSETSENIIGVELVNERYTSIKCPICHKSKPENKSKNGFNCNYCGFYHKRPDVVACRNILDNYRENKDKQ